MVSLDHLSPAVQELAKEPGEVRINRILADRWIGYLRANDAIETLEWFLRHPKRMRMTNLLLVGPPNKVSQMEWIVKSSDMFVRLDPGELLVESLRKIAAEVGFAAAAITSGVGMLSSVELGFFEVDRDDYNRRVLNGIFDLSSVQGNIVLRDLEYVPHVHLVFNDPTFGTYSGHLIEATCHITTLLS